MNSRQFWMELRAAFSAFVLLMLVLAAVVAVVVGTVALVGTLIAALVG